MLAIAGLIFMVVFLALPALQRSQRDTARRQDVAKSVAAIQQYFADGGSGTPAILDVYAGYKSFGETGSPLDSYLKNAGLSSNVRYENIRAGNGTAYPVIDTIELWPAHKCGAKASDDSVQMTPATSGDMAVVVRLESGNTTSYEAAGGVFYCADASR